jgi:hypothetical protein
MIQFEIRRLTSEDASRAFDLFEIVSAMPASGLARRPDEMSLAYFQDLLVHVPMQSVSLGAFSGGI